tara:strand:+ start:407 stop:1261 length:855 start_codon:yes stop_codon:yes gene_type:complete
MDEVLRITTKSQSGSKLTKEEKKILDAWEEGGFLAGPAKAREYMDKRKQQSDKEISDLVKLSMSNFGKDIKKHARKFPPRTIGLREALEDCKKELSMTKSLLSQAKTKRAAHRKFGVGGRRRRTRRKRRRKKRRGGMYAPGMMQDWTGILDPHDALKSNLIKPKYLPKEMKPMAKKYVDQLMDNSINLASFQNYLNKIDMDRKQLKKSGSNKEYVEQIKRETNRFKDIIKGIENDNKKLKKKLEDLSKPSTKKVVNPGTPYRRFEGGKKRKTRKKRRKRRKSRR